MNAKYKKSLKIVTLLASTLLIATASAQIYRYMFIEGTVTIGNTGLTWIEGDSAPSGTDITGNTATLPLDVSNGTLANFTHVLYLENLDASDHDLTIEITDAANPTLYETLGFNATISTNSTGALVDTLNVLTTDSYSGTIPASTVWEVSFQIQTAVDASGSDDFSMQFSYE